MVNFLSSFVLFGRDLLDGSVASTILLVILAEAALLVLVLFALLIVVIAKHAGGRERDYFVASKPTEEPITLRELILDTENVRRNFVKGGEFDYRGLVVTALYSDGREEEVTDYIVVAPDLDEAGNAFVTVKYEDAIAEYPITVDEPVSEPAYEEETAAGSVRSVVSIEPDLTDVTTRFNVGYPFNSDGLRVFAEYDAEPYREEVFGFDVEGVDTSVAGEAAVTVRYGAFTCQYTVTVEAQRKFVGISLDTTAVRKEFYIGENLDTTGLIVIARYDAEPYSEEISDYTVAEPDCNTEGVKEVVVNHGGESASYEVTFKFGEEEETSVLRYDRSFTARLIQADDETKQWYCEIKNALLSYKKVKDRMSWKKETYRYNKEKVARMGFRGKTLCLYLALDPNEYVDSKYKAEDASDNASTTDTPLLYRIKNDKRVKYAVQLIDEMMTRLEAVKTDREPVDYYLPYEGTFNLINKGLIKREIKSSSEEALFRSDAPAAETPAEAAPAIYGADEETEDGNVYEWSFKGRLCNSYDDVKENYGKIKNRMLSYRGLNSTLSGYNEIFSVDGNTAAKFAFIDGTLSLFLALDPSVYDGVGYMTVNVSDKAGYEDTPLMFAIKSERDVSLAEGLIADLAFKFALKEFPKAEEDFYEPYKDREQLVTEGLVTVRKQ